MNRFFTASAAAACLVAAPAFGGSMTASVVADPDDPLARYNLIVFGDLAGVSSNIEGRTLVGGNVTGSAGDFAVRASISPDDDALRVGGNLSLGNANVQRGGVTVGGASTSNINLNGPGDDTASFGGPSTGNVNGAGGGVFPNLGAAASVEVSGIRNDLEAYSSNILRGLTGESVSKDAANNLVFDADHRSGVVVFEINGRLFDAAGGNNVNQYRLENAAHVDAVVVNVIGDNLRINTGNMNAGSGFDALADRTVWNFFEAGTLLADDLIDIDSGNGMTGTVVAQSITNLNAQIHLPTAGVRVTSVPAPSAALAAGMGLLALAARRPRRFA